MYRGFAASAVTLAIGLGIAIAGASITNAVLFISARSDVTLPSNAKDHRAVMADFKTVELE